MLKTNRREASTNQVVKPVNLNALTAWVKNFPDDVKRDVTQLAPMLAKLGYDPHGWPPNYGTPDKEVLENQKRLEKDADKWIENMKIIEKDKSKLVDDVLKEERGGRPQPFLPQRLPQQPGMEPRKPRMQPQKRPKYQGSQARDEAMEARRMWEEEYGRKKRLRNRREPAYPGRQRGYY